MANVNTDFSDLLTTTANNRVHRYDLDALKKRLESYKGQISEDAYNQLMNAYSTYHSAKWQPNAWQAIGERFGDYAAWNNFEIQRMNNFNTSVSEILNAQHQEDYTDPEAELARRKAAGLNDDLNGGSSVGSGQPGDIALPDNLPAPQNDMQSSVQEMASAGMQVVSLCMSLASSFQSLKSGALDNFLKEISADSGMYQLFNDTVIRSVTPEVYKQWESKSIDEDSWFLLSDRIKDALQGISSDPHFSHSFRRRFARKFIDSGYANTIAGKKAITDSLKAYYGNISDIGRSGSTPYFDTDFGKMLDDVSEYVNKYQMEAQKLLDKYNIDRLSTTGEDGKTSLGSAAGQSDMKAYQAESVSKDIQKLENQMWDDLYRGLSRRNDFWSKLGMFAIPIVRGMITNMRMPSVSHSTSTDAKGNVTSHRSFGF